MLITIVRNAVHPKEVSPYAPPALEVRLQNPFSGPLHSRLSSMANCLGFSGSVTVFVSHACVGFRTHMVLQGSRQSGGQCPPKPTSPAKSGAWLPHPLPELGSQVSVGCFFR